MYGKPSVPSGVTVTESGINVEIQWTSPTSTGGTGIALQAYTVQI